MRPARNIIYGIVDPRTLLVRYVGKSTFGLERTRQHKHQAKRERTYKANWLKSLCAAGLEYIVVVFETEPPDLTAAERFWIAYGRASGWPLTNLTDGGEGRPGYVMPDGTRMKLSLLHKGIPKSDAHKARLRAVNLGVKRGPHSAETKAKIGAGNRGKTVSLETRLKLRSKRHSDATKESLRQQAVGRKASPETRRKLSEAQTARWARIRERSV